MNVKCILIGSLFTVSLQLAVLAAEFDFSAAYPRQAPNSSNSTDLNGRALEDVEIDSQKKQEWSIHLQTNYVEQRKNNFNSPISSTRSTSLLSRTDGDNNRSFSYSTTAYLGAKLWNGAEGFYNPEIFEGTPFTGALVGLGGFQNGELQKGTYIPAVAYNARAFIRQTFGLGTGDQYIPEATVNQLAQNGDKDKVVLTWGKVASLDFFDMNTFSHDPRSDFMNFSVFSMGAYGYAADPRGYTYGLIVEWYQNDWILKAGRLATPKVPNTRTMDYSLTKDFVDQIEFSHMHKIGNQPGALRGIVFREHAYMTTYQDALNAGNLNPSDSFIGSRKINANYGYGFNAEQSLSADLGVFARYSWNNDKSETNTLDVGSSFTLGSSLKGNRWGRVDDTFGLAWAANNLSNEEVRYLQAGGQTAFIGDAPVSFLYKPEQILEAYYSARIYKQSFLSADFQRIQNPGYNLSRGPINVISMRFHFEI